MKESTKIKLKISQLEREYQKALEKEKPFISSKDKSINSVGCYDVGKIQVLLQRLTEGETLRFEHSCYGQFLISMNPQCNRISVDPPNPDVAEYTILNVMASWSGDWYIE